jgi:excisionase family DNA binding protein
MTLLEHEAVGQILPDSSFAQEIGFTSDKFDGYLWQEDERVIISMIVSLDMGKGNLSRLFKAIEAKGYQVAVSTPLGRMQQIITRKGFRPHMEPFIIDGELIDMVEVWMKEFDSEPGHDHNEQMPTVYLSVGEAAEYLKVGRSRITTLIYQGRFPGAVKIGKEWKIPAEAVINFTYKQTGRPPKKRRKNG